MRVFLMMFAVLVGVITTLPAAGTYGGAIIGYAIGVPAGGLIVYLTERQR